MKIIILVPYRRKQVLSRLWKAAGCAVLFLFCFLSNSFAKDITILYTGSSHAMLYPCNCPIEPDGGIARRASLINELRRKNPDTLVLDAGGFFAGGILDQYTQNTDLDSKRTAINLEAMELMKYDAVNISDTEFNFGRQFLEDSIAKTKIPFLSCNIKSDKLLPYILKDTGGVKIGIIGVTELFSEQKTGGIKLLEPKERIKSAIAWLRKNNADIIVLLSYSSSGQIVDLIKEIEGIDILIESTGPKQGQTMNKIGNTIVAGASWEARRLGKLTITVTDKKITNYNIEELRLSDKIRDDRDMQSILPQCFSDLNCKKSGAFGICRNPGEKSANCFFTEAAKINLMVITPKECVVCEAGLSAFVDYLKKQFPGLVTSYLYYPGEEAEKFIRDFGIKALPAYLLGKEAQKDPAFEGLKKNLEPKGDYYLLKLEFTGLSYFLGRNTQKGKLDLFVSLYQKDTKDLLDMVKEYNPTVHFLAAENGEGFDAIKGNAEVEEYLRSVCVQKYYPENFWNYISCRAKNFESSWWEDCLPAGLDPKKIKTCAQGQEGKSLLKEDIALNKELQVMFGPAFLLDNQEIFGFKVLPTKEQLRKVLKR